MRIASMLRLRPVVKAGLGVAACTGVVGGAQGLYLYGQYRALPEPRGPLSGVVQYLREKQQQQQSSTALAHAPVAGEASASASASAPQPQPTPPPGQAPRAGFLVRTLSGSASGADGAEGAPTRPRKNILFVGDSLVTGVGCAPDANAGPTLPRACAAFLAKALRVDVTWAAIGQTGADVASLNNLLPAVGREVRNAQERGGTIDMVVVVCGLNDFKHAYTSFRRTASGFKMELSAFVEALHAETGVQCTVVLPALPLHHAPVFSQAWPCRPLICQIASWWDDQKAALAERASALTARRICFVYAAHPRAPPARPARAPCPPRARVRVLRGLSGRCAARRGDARRRNNVEGFYEIRRYWAADGIHPNDEGYQLWGEHIGMAVVRQALLSGPAKLAPSAGVAALAPKA